jgi:hypothetical protein
MMVLQALRGPDEVSILYTLKDWRKQPEGREWEPIKIPHRNLAYIPKLIRRPSLLTRSRPASYR